MLNDTELCEARTNALTHAVTCAEGYNDILASQAVKTSPMFTSIVQLLVAYVRYYTSVFCIIVHNVIHRRRYRLLVTFLVMTVGSEKYFTEPKLTVLH